MPKQLLPLVLLFFFVCGGHAQAQIEKYFGLFYYYPNTQIMYMLGEMRVVHVDQTVDTLSPQYIDCNNWNCRESLQNLSDSTITSAFEIQSGDIITFVKEIQLDFADQTGYVGIVDTIKFTTQLIEVGTGNVLLQLDTAGVYPTDSLTDMLQCFINRDTSVVTVRSIPSSLQGKCAYLRVDIAFSGPDSLDSVCRRDISMVNHLSHTLMSNRVLVDSIIQVLIAEGVIDTTLTKSLSDWRRQSADEKMFESYSVSVRPNPSRGIVNLRVFSRDGQFAECEIVIFDIAGKIMHRIGMDTQAELHLNLAHLQPGSYLAVPFVNGRMYRGRGFTIVY